LSWLPRADEARINLVEIAQQRRLLRLTRHVHFFDAAPRELPAGLSLPEKDVPIFLEARATHLITGDIRHLGLYFNKQIAGILVLPPADYLKEHPR
jgi:hypothetical protein